MPYVYMLRCVDNTFYTGWTTDMEKRLAAHRQGIGSKYTRARLPVTLAYLEEVDNKGAALQREYKIRRLKRHEKELLAYTFAKKEHQPHRTNDGAGEEIGINHEADNLV